MLGCLVSYGQITEVLVDTNKLWSNLFDTHTGGPPPYYLSTTFIKFSGDTVINGTYFKKVLATKDSLLSNFFNAGYIHEDSMNKVLYYSPYYSSIRLLYDFNAKVGDTIDIGYSTPIPLVVDTVDSIFIYNQYLKRMVLSLHGSSGEQWIQGIGSLCGVLNSGAYFTVGAFHELLCYYENDTLKYSNPAYTNCYYNTVGVNNIFPVKHEVCLYPN